MNENTLKRKIMRRVYLLFVIGKLKHPMVIEMFVLALSFAAIAYTVSLRDVLANTPRDVNGLYHFWTNAFLGTGLIVKILVLSVIATSLLIGKKATWFMYENTTNTARKILARA